MSLRSNLSVLESRYGDAKAKLESLEEQNRKNQEELEAKLAKASETKKETETAEMNALREANENLKVLLSGAEKKYMRISGLNLELQKKVDNLEQKNRMSMDQVYGYEMGFDCRSVNMRQVNRSTLREIESENESEEELSLIGNVRMRSDTEK